MKKAVYNKFYHTMKALQFVIQLIKSHYELLMSNDLLLILQE